MEKNTSNIPDLPGEKGTEHGYCNLSGLRMYYEISGSGTPLVLVHGGGSTIDTTFGRVLHRFAQSHTVVAVELQAHGHTPDIDRPLSFERDADDIAALLQQLGISGASVFGFSNGATTALQFAIRHPDKTHKIVVASTIYKRQGAPAWFWEMIGQASFEGMPQLYKDAFLKINPDPDALYRMYERDIARMQDFPDITESQMRAIKAPALIIAGDKDVPTAEHLVEMHRLLMGSRLAIIPGGHGEYIGEITTRQNPVLVAATVLLVNRFLDDDFL